MQVGAQVFDAMGNHALLQRPMHAVHVRRRFSDQERRAYMNACILAARQGRVLVGAFVSEYEQQVRAVALREGHAVVQLTTDLLTDYYKPSGSSLMLVVESKCCCYRSALPWTLSPVASPAPSVTPSTPSPRR